MQTHINEWNNFILVYNGLKKAHPYTIKKIPVASSIVFPEKKIRQLFSPPSLTGCSCWLSYVCTLYTLYTVNKTWYMQTPFINSIIKKSFTTELFSSRYRTQKWILELTTEAKISWFLKNTPNRKCKVKPAEHKSSF